MANCSDDLIAFGIRVRCPTTSRILSELLHSTTGGRAFIRLLDPSYLP